MKTWILIVYGKYQFAFDIYDMNEPQSKINLYFQNYLLISVLLKNDYII